MENSNIDAEKYSVSVEVFLACSRTAIALDSQNIKLFNTTRLIFA